MQKVAKINAITKIKDTNVKPENGLVNLVAYYQNKFEREENLHHYSPVDYQNAKRKFVKFSLKHRSM